jgi:hypothetical protein
MSRTRGIYRGGRGCAVQGRNTMWSANSRPLWKPASRRPPLPKRLQKRRATASVLEIAYVLLLPWILSEPYIYRKN